MFLTAEIIVVGSEFFTRFKKDSNSIWLAEQLERRGVRVMAKRVVADDLAALAAAYRGAASRVDLVISTGGLGPTEDDRTREAIALACETKLVLRPELVEQIAARFALRGRAMSPNNERQALIPEGAEVLENPHGTAPGFYLCLGQAYLVALPGPPREMMALYQDFTKRCEHAYPTGTVLTATRILKVTGLGESDMDERISELYKDVINPEVTINFTPCDLEIHLTARAESVEATEALLEPMVAQMSERLEAHLFSAQGESLAEVVSRMARERGITLALAESLTGGLAAHRLASIPGASEIFPGGIVAYTAEAKQNLLAVNADTIERFSVVSEQVALEMAGGVQKLFRSDIGLSCTGYAGPGGGTEKDPVGTAYLGLCWGGRRLTRRVSVPGDRDLVRSRIVQAMLYWLFTEFRAADASGK